MTVTLRDHIVDTLGRQGEELLAHVCHTIPKEKLTLPGPDWVDRVSIPSGRTPRVIQSLHTLTQHGRLRGTGYLNILPFDHGIEHGAGPSFTHNPDYFDPEMIFRLAWEGGVSGLAAPLGVLGTLARKYAHKVPLILKLNHHDTLHLPPVDDQTLWASVDQAWNMGCVAVGATLYFDTPTSHRQIIDVSRAFAMAHDRGLVTILWCYLRNPPSREAADLTGQANYLGASLNADLVKQKLPTHLTASAPFPGLDRLSSPHPIDLARYQVAHCFAGRMGLLNSGGRSDHDDRAQGIMTALVNKRAGGMGLVLGRKAFQKPLKEGISILHTLQDIYLSPEITVA